MKNKILKRKPTTPAKAIEILAKSTLKRYFNDETNDNTQNIEPQIENQMLINKPEKQKVKRKLNSI